MYTIKCPTCKKKFEGNVRSKFCSRECTAASQRKTAKIPKICGVCKKKFEIGRNNQYQRFCSKRCGRTNIRNEAELRKSKRPKRKCEVCKADITKMRAKSFCSKECSNKAKTKVKVKTKCAYCNKKFLHRKSSKRKFCSWLCGCAGKRPPIRETGPTKIEKTLKSIIKSLGLTHKTEHVVTRDKGRRYVLDVALVHLKLDLEADGNYFHCNYCCLCTTSKGKGKRCDACGLERRNNRQEASLVSDVKRDRFMEKMGWKVVRFTETELKFEIEKVRALVKRAVRMAKHRLTRC